MNEPREAITDDELVCTEWGSDDLSAGLADHAGLINVLVGAWHDFGYATPPGPDCATVPPLGQRSAAAVEAGHDALNAVDEMTRQLQALRGQLAGELRRDEELRKDRP